MARVTHVKAAKQRYRMVPVIDPATGQTKETPVMAKSGQQKTNKNGRPVTRRVTQEDRTQPLPLLTCDYCHKDIELGTPYKWIKPKSGPYGGYQKNRHASCPTWQVWDYSSSMSARLAQIEWEFRESLGSSPEDPEDVRSALEEAANSIRELAEEKRESASNIEEGFGHSTYLSEELESTADELESWADEVEQVDVPDLPEPEEVDRWFVVMDGERVWAKTLEAEEGYETAEEAQAALQATVEDGELEEDTLDVVQDTYTPEEPTEDQMEEWRSEVEDAVAIVGESPV